MMELICQMILVVYLSSIPFLITTLWQTDMKNYVELKVKLSA